jgi:sugar phosphate isomerase/epimerase
MKISCSTAAFIDPSSSIEQKLKDSIEAINNIVKYGYDGIELFIPNVFSDDQKEILFQEASKIKGKILTIHAPKNTLHRPLKEIFTPLSKLIKKASELEANYIVLHPPFQKNFKSLIRTIFYIFDNILLFAKRNNVTLTIENVPYLLDPPEFFKNICEKYKDGLGITIDIEYLYSTPYSLDKYPKELLSKYLKNIHIRDYDGQSFDEEGNRRYLKLGEGFINFKEFFERLFDINYDSILTIETVFNNKIEDLIYSKEFIIKHLPQKSLASG